MFTLTKEQCLSRFRIIWQNYSQEEQKKILIEDLIELAYKSGYHDGWYDASKNK